MRQDRQDETDGSRVGVDGRNASVAIINIRMVESAI
jgi:hypothetical protein